MSVVLAVLAVATVHAPARAARDWRRLAASGEDVNAAGAADAASAAEWRAQRAPGVLRAALDEALADATGALPCWEADELRFASDAAAEARRYLSHVPLGVPEAHSDLMGKAMLSPGRARRKLRERLVWTLAREPGKQFRVVILGDSVTAGHDIWGYQAVADQAHNELVGPLAVAGINASVANFGMGGTAPFPNALCFEELLGADPDLVVFQHDMTADDGAAFTNWLTAIAQHPSHPLVMKMHPGWGLEGPMGMSEVANYDAWMPGAKRAGEEGFEKELFLYAGSPDDECDVDQWRLGEHSSMPSPRQHEKRSGHDPITHADVFIGAEFGGHNFSVDYHQANWNDNGWDVAAESLGTEEVWLSARAAVPAQSHAGASERALASARMSDDQALDINLRSHHSPSPACIYPPPPPRANARPPPHARARPALYPRAQMWVQELTWRLVNEPGFSKFHETTHGKAYAGRKKFWTCASCWHLSPYGARLFSYVLVDHLLSVFQEAMVEYASARGAGRSDAEVATEYGERIVAEAEAARAALPPPYLKDMLGATARDPVIDVDGDQTFFYHGRVPTCRTAIEPQAAEPGTAASLMSIVIDQADWWRGLPKSDETAVAGALSKDRGYHDFKYGLIGTADSGWLVLNVTAAPNGQRGPLIVCETFHGWGRDSSEGSLANDVIFKLDGKREHAVKTTEVRSLFASFPLFARQQQ